MKRKIFLLYEFYWPFYKAGGPVQSIYNIVGTLSDSFQFYLVSRSSDVDGTLPPNPVEVGKWVNGNQGEKIYYLSSVSIWQVVKLLQQVKPDVVMVNGIFNISTTIPGILFSHCLKYKLVISPRGMLQKGALAVHPVKKKIFLFLFRLMGIGKNAVWHATDSQEETDITNVIGEKMHVKIVPNIPKQPWSTSAKPKRQGVLRMVYLSLVAKKKNLDLALKALAYVKTPMLFHVYGPIKDRGYWNNCKLLMKSDIHEIEYIGEVTPNDVQRKLESYDLMILPTNGENFGHSIYESLSAGTPVLLSPHTPWGSLQDHGAGITISSQEPKAWAEAINQIIKLNDSEYHALSMGAINLANAYFSHGDFVRRYEDLFS